MCEEEKREKERRREEKKTATVQIPPIYQGLPPIFDFEDRERERVEIFIQFHISIKPKF